MSRNEAGDTLPWEHDDGEPVGVGICLSGGGLRAASFSLGVVQALQADRGLLYGKHSARYLAVVSGGSYLGASEMLNADGLNKPASDMAPPLEEHAPETEHIVSHGDYLKNLRTASKMALGGAVNVMAFVAIFAWAGVMVSVVIALARAIGIGSLSGDALQLGAAVLFFVGARTVLRGLYLDGGATRLVLILLGEAVVVITAPSAIAAMRLVAPLSTTEWWAHGYRVLLAVIGAGLLIVVSIALARIWSQRVVARASAWFAARIPALIGFVPFCLFATGYARSVDRAVDSTGAQLPGILFFAVLFAALAGQILGRTSLHGMYRDSLADCFSVVRSAGGVELVAPTAEKLSDLTPPNLPVPSSYPRLLVCATANVIWDPANPNETGLSALLPHKRVKFASFVYSHDRCGLPGVHGASFATTDLERLTTKAGILPRREPLVSLMTAVASAGAAVSPAMGRKTSDLFRPLIALSNLRLGRWLPNPLSARMRDLVQSPDADKRLARKRGIGGAYDEFVPELFGLHHADAARVYISDGGHYDNLGLLALLQARCAEIWCIDAQADRWGEAGQLRNVLKLAKQTLRVKIAIDLSVFAGAEPGVFDQAHVSGEIDYGGGGRGSLHVIKLGLTADSDSSLRQYQREDRGFPYHDTFWPPWQVMWYGPRRFDSYRQVGFANGISASRAKRERDAGP